MPREDDAVAGCERAFNRRKGSAAHENRVIASKFAAEPLLIFAGDVRALPSVPPRVIRPSSETAASNVNCGLWPLRIDFFKHRIVDVLFRLDEQFTASIVRSEAEGRNPPHDRKWRLLVAFPHRNNRGGGDAIYNVGALKEEPPPENVRHAAITKNRMKPEKPD